MSASLRILLTHTPAMREAYVGARALGEFGRHAIVRLHDGCEPLDEGTLVAAAAGCRIIVADRNTPITAAVIAALPDLAAVSRIAVDIRNIDVEAASRAGVLVTQASRTWVPAVAELVLGLMIDAARGISRANVAYKAGARPDIRMGRQLAGATAGIIGYGPLGAAVADLCLAFAMRVIVADPYKQVERAGIEQASLADVVTAADFVIPLAVATAETENLIGRSQFALMKPGAILVNLSRGDLVDEAALVEALDAGRIAGAAMDVGRSADQMPSPVIAARPDVTATPHIGGLTREAIEGQALEVADQVGEIAAGRVPKGAVNANHWTRPALLGAC